MNFIIDAIHDKIFNELISLDKRKLMCFRSIEHLSKYYYIHNHINRIYADVYAKL